MMFPSICETCNKTAFYYASELPRRYCSVGCRDEGCAKYVSAPCLWCGGKKKRRNFKFCSFTCRGAYKRAAGIGQGRPIGAPVKLREVRS